MIFEVADVLGWLIFEVGDMRRVGGCAKLGRRGGRVLSAAAIRKIYVLHTLVQGAIFTRSSSGDGIHTPGESQHQRRGPI